MDTEFSTDLVVIGAGVVGLAIAREFAQHGREVIVLEKNSSFGMETSSRNSEVIHAGIYYEANSLKARLCVQGKQLLYDYCASRKVPFRKTGKLIVATRSQQLTTLETINEKARANGVTDLQFFDENSTLKLEPSLCAVGSLFSPSTGIIDSHALMLSLLGELEDYGGSVAYNNQVEFVKLDGDGFTLGLSDIAANSSETTLNCRTLVNCGGLSAVHIAKNIDGLDRKTLPEARYAKGSYFSYSGACPFRHLIYPVPEPGGLGIHLTLDLGYSARFGPNVEWVDILNYDVNPQDKSAFLDAISRYFPTIDPQKLNPDYAGMRPKIFWNGEMASDFCIAGPETHKLPGLINLFGVESPGLTSCLALARYVRELEQAQG